MRNIHCFHCSSDEVEFKADILVGCCQHKSGELWHCNQCGKDMAIQVVFSEEEANVDCPHGSSEGGHNCGGCHGSEDLNTSE